MNTAVLIAHTTTTKRVVWMVFALVLLYFGIQLVRYHYLMVAFPYPLEFREGAVLYTTNLLLEGENPYALENMPTAINVYGINYHWVVYPFARLWGPTFTVHRAVSAVLLWLACSLFFVILRSEMVEPLYSFSGMLILYSSLLYRYTPLARPDALGFFLFLLSISIAYLKKYAPWSLLTSSLAGIAAFYTKAYFVVSIPYLAIYLFLFVSKKKAVIYSLLSGLLLIFTALVTNALFETYFINTFFNHINVATNDINQLRLQLGLFVVYNSGLILLLIVFVCLAAFDRHAALPSWNKGLLKDLRKQSMRISLLDFEKPLIGVTFPFWLYCLLFSFTVFYFKLGRHNGNHMTYAYHILTPFLLIVTYRLFRLRLSNLPSRSFIQAHGYLMVIPCILVSLNLVYTTVSSLQETRIENLKAWRRVEQITKSYDNIMNSPVIASLILQQGKVVYDGGQTEYFRYSHYSATWLSSLLVSNAMVSHRWTEYEHTIQKMVRQQEFDAILLAPRDHSSYVDGLERGYRLLDTIELCMYQSQQCTPLEIWEAPRSATLNE